MAKEEQMTYLSANGTTKIHAVKWMPEDGKYKAILQITHGMIEYIERYHEFAEYLTERGFMVVGHDHLGHGASVKDETEWGYFAENPSDTLVADMHSLRTTVQGENPGIPYFMMGHSMGSFILRNYITRYGTGISGAIICGTGTPKKSQLVGGKLLTSILGKLKGDTYVSKLVNEMSTKAYMSGEGMETEFDWICSDRAVQEAYAKDPLCSGFTFTVNGYHTLYELAHRMQKKENLEKIPKKLPVLIVSGTEDPVGDRGEAPKALYDTLLHLDITKTTLKLYNGARHELLNEKIKETVYYELYNWMEIVLNELQ
mgnify:CR=1 FL=1